MATPWAEREENAAEMKEESQSAEIERQIQDYTKKRAHMSEEFSWMLGLNMKDNCLWMISFGICAKRALLYKERIWIIIHELKSSFPAICLEIFSDELI